MSLRTRFPATPDDQLRDPTVFTREVGFIQDASILGSLLERGVFNKTEAQAVYRELVAAWQPIYQSRESGAATG